MIHVEIFQVSCCSGNIALKNAISPLIFKEALSASTSPPQVLRFPLKDYEYIIKYLLSLVSVVMICVDRKYK